MTEAYLPLTDLMITGFDMQAGTPTGRKAYLVAPCKGRLMEIGFTPNSAVTSALTVAVAIGAQTSSVASSFTQCITSTLGTFSSTNLQEGLTQTIEPPAVTLVGDNETIQFTFSGGQSSAVGATLYAIVRRSCY